jgi:hypothetical protein
LKKNNGWILVDVVLSYTCNVHKMAPTMKARECREYHVVDQDDLRKFGRFAPDKAAKEISLRVKYVKKYHRNKFDHRHAKWMQKLEGSLNLTSKINLSLDALVALNKVKQVR